MDRRVVAALVVALLAVSAGCSGPLFGGDGGGRDPFGVPETTVPRSTTARTPTATTTETTTTLTPAASSAFRAAVTNHTAILGGAGQFVIRESINTSIGETRPNQPFSTNRSFAADITADRYWFGVASSPADGVYDSGKLYQNGTAVFRQVVSANGTAVYRRFSPGRSGAEPRNLMLAWLRTIPNATVHQSLQRNGSATFRGEKMTRFTAGEPGHFGCGASVGPGEEVSIGGRALVRLQNITEFRLTVLVSNRGIVRKFECVLRGRLYTGEPYTVRVTWTITEIGTATVRPPDRLVNATDPREG